MHVDDGARQFGQRRPLPFSLTTPHLELLSERFAARFVTSYLAEPLHDSQICHSIVVPNLCHHFPPVSPGQALRDECVVCVWWVCVCVCDASPII